MAKKPNYDFERREREKARAAKVADRMKAKAEKAVSADAVAPREVAVPDDLRDAALDRATDDEAQRRRHEFFRG